MDASSNKFEIIQEVVSQDNNKLSVKMLCEIAGVSRSGYYKWINSIEQRKIQEEKDRNDFEIILTAYKHRGYDKGAKGIHMNLLHQEPPVVMNIKKIRRLMSKYNLICPIRTANPYRRLAKALKTNHVAKNLVNREFTKHGPRKVLLTDITYIPYNGVFCYLSTILDAFTRQVLSYVLSDSLEVDFVCNLGYSRLYIQSAFSIPDEEKREQETKSFVKINDSFKKIIITNDIVQPYYDDNGIITMNIFDFLLNPKSLDSIA